MPVLTSETMNDRPGKRAIASAMPKGMPSSNETNVAQPEILSDSQVIDHTSASKPKISATALTLPCQISSTLRSEPAFLLARNRHEQRLAEFSHAEAFDHLLRLRRNHEVGERLAAGRVHARAVGWIHFEDRVNVQKRTVAFEQNRQAHALAERQISAAIADRVGVAFVGDAEGCAHALSRFDVPGAFGFDARGFL